MKKFIQNKYVPIIWTIMRIYLGYQYLSAGLEKMTDSKWVGSNAGVAVSGFLKGALVKATGENPAVQSWYASFVRNFALPHATIFSYLVTFGEVLVGISLILGLFTLIGLVGGYFLSLNYLLGGSISTNPILMTIGIILLLVGSATYYYGADHFVLPYAKRLLGKKATLKSSS